MPHLSILIILAASLLTGCVTSAQHPSLRASASLPTLIPVRDFVANRGSNFAYRLSPDGKKLAWVAVQGVSLHFFIKDLEQGSTRTLPAGNFYGEFVWARDSRHLLFEPSLGDENRAVVRLDTTAPEAQPELLTPWGAMAHLVALPAGEPEQLLIAHNQRDKTVFDLYRVNLNTFESSLLAQNPGDVTQWLADPQGHWAGRIVKQAGHYTLELNASGSAYRWTSNDEVKFVSLDPQAKRLYLLSNKDRDRMELIEVDPASGTEKVLHADPTVDVVAAYTHPHSGQPLLAYSEPDYPQATRLADDLPTSFGITHGPARVRVINSDDAFHQLVLNVTTDKGQEHYLYDLRNRQSTRLGGSPQLTTYRKVLADMRPISFQSRDQVPLHGYLTLPKNVPPRALPLVLWVHGGPFERDDWSSDPDVQFLANRGYAVLQVNFRGSTGYGRRFQELAIGQFAGKMQDDLLDGVQWAIAQGIADPARIAIGGGSYGGYASLVGLTTTPDTFACGVDLFGPTDLVRLAEDFPPYWKLEMDRWSRYAGDPAKAEDRAAMQSKSPLFHTERIRKPLLVIQGGQDVRVKPEQSIELVERLRQQNKPVEFWLVPEAGHGLMHWPQRLTQFRKTEDFLASCLGGRSSGFDYYQLGSWLF